LTRIGISRQCDMSDAFLLLSLFGKKGH